MAGYTDPRVVKRFIILLLLLTIVTYTGRAIYTSFTEAPPGDYEVRQGDILLSSKKYDDALESFTLALKRQPDHRGALMGRALVFINTKKYDEAVAELRYLIDFLKRTLKEGDATGRATLAAAYGNLGIVLDRQAKYQQAIDNYVLAIKTDEGVTEGPGVIDQTLYYKVDASSIRDRAEYLYKQLQLPEDRRLLRVPELDDQQRMHKP